MSYNERGALNVLLIPVIVLSLLVIGVSAFGIWAYTQYQEYRDNVEPMIATAVADAKVEQQRELAAEFAEREKEPFRRFTAPEQFGSLSFDYPKTWSVYVDRTGEGNNPYEAYLHPNVIQPADSKHPDALRISINNRAYDASLREFESRIRRGELSASPYNLPSGGEGTRIDGTFEDGIEGSMIVFPLRDKTVRVYTESNTYLGDFNDIILPSLTFIP